MLLSTQISKERREVGADHIEAASDKYYRSYKIRTNTMRKEHYLQNQTFRS